MRESWRHGMFAAIAMLGTAPVTSAAAAQQATSPPLPNLAAMSEDQILTLLRETGSRWQTEPCSFGIPVVGELARKVGGDQEIDRANLLVQVLCANEEDRFADGARLVAELNAQNPEPDIHLALYFASRLEDADALLAILRGIDGGAFEQLSRDNYWPVVRTLRTGGRSREYEALTLEWATTGKLRRISADLQSAIAVSALRAAARSGQTAIAPELLRSITSPSDYIDLLTERDFEPFWPLIERRAGPNLATIGAEHVRLMRARRADAPEVDERLSDLAHALHFNGDFAEAIALAERWRERGGAGAAIEEGDGWALNIQAYAYDSTNQSARADAVFDQLAALDPDSHPWLVNFVINRASRLVGQGRWSEGLEAARLARSVADTQGTVYAKSIIARDFACALFKLGRSEEAASELAYLRENWRDGIQLAAQGLMCHGLRDEAAALLLQGLRDERVRSSAIGAFVGAEQDLFYTASILPSPVDLLADHPDVARELATHVRPLPPAFTPQASLRRIRQNLPAWE